MLINRIEGSQLETRDQNKMWLVRHLEITRQIMIDDLRVVKVKVDVSKLGIYIIFKNEKSELLKYHIDLACVVTINQ